LFQSVRPVAAMNDCSHSNDILILYRAKRFPRRCKGRGRVPLLVPRSNDGGVVNAFHGSVARLHAVCRPPPVSNHPQTDRPPSELPINRLSAIYIDTSVFIVTYRLQLPVLANSICAVFDRENYV